MSSVRRAPTWTPTLPLIGVAEKFVYLIIMPYEITILVSEYLGLHNVGYCEM